MLSNTPILHMRGMRILALPKIPLRRVFGANLLIRYIYTQDVEFSHRLKKKGKGKEGKKSFLLCNCNSYKGLHYSWKTTKKVDRKLPISWRKNNLSKQQTNRTLRKTKVNRCPIVHEIFYLYTQHKIRILYTSSNGPARNRSRDKTRMREKRITA